MGRSHSHGTLEGLATLAWAEPQAACLLGAPIGGAMHAALEQAAVHAALQQAVVHVHVAQRPSAELVRHSLRTCSCPMQVYRMARTGKKPALDAEESHRLVHVQ